MRQEDVLSVLRSAGRPMTLNEICEELLLEPNPANRSNAHSRIRVLRKKGLVRLVGYTCRAAIWEAVQ